VRCTESWPDEASRHEPQSRQTQAATVPQGLVRLCGPASQNSRAIDRLGRCAVAALVLIFVVGMFADAEAAVGARENSVAAWRPQHSAKPCNAYPSGSVEVAYPADTVEPRPFLLNVRLFLRRQDAASIKIGKGTIEPGHKGAAEVQSGINTRIGRQRTFITDDMASNAELPGRSVGPTCIDAGQIYDDGCGLRDVASEPQMLYANPRTMRGEKFISSKSDLILTRSIETDSGDAHSESSGEQQSSIAHQPFRVVHQRLIGSLLPFLQGFGVGAGILLLCASIILRSKKC
jgi:hypothetical protein